VVKKGALKTAYKDGSWLHFHPNSFFTTVLYSS